MANEEKKDFNAMLHRANGMPKVQLVTDEATVKKYGGTRMYFAPPLAYDTLMWASCARFWPAARLPILPTPSPRAFLYPLPHGQVFSGRQTRRPIGAP